MAWTWKGFWGDDPVYRFNCGRQDFFQAGRSKAEERFWVNYIHDDGSYLRPLRSRLSSRASSVISSASKPRTRNISTQSDTTIMSPLSSSTRTRNSSSGSTSDQVVITSVTSAVDEKRSDSSTNISEEEFEDSKHETKDDDKVSSITCRCQSTTPEKERYISRVI